MMIEAHAVERPGSGTGSVVRPERLHRCNGSARAQKRDKHLAFQVSSPYGPTY